jgi:class 3 adenylate cyclase
MSFRTQLALFSLAVVLLAGVPAAFLEARRPWETLESLVAQGRTLLAGVESGFARADLARMSAFGLRMAKETAPYREDCLGWAFGQIVLRGALLTEAEMRLVLEKEAPGTGRLDYAAVGDAFAFWKARFDAEPGLLEVFRKAKLRLMEANGSAARAGFDVNDTYVMVDDGATFAFLVDGSDWFNCSYAGQRFDTVATDSQHFRAYLKNGAGFDHNPMHAVYGIFPKFDTDQWGTWFTTWLSVREGKTWNVYSLDLDAAGVKRLMWRVAATLAGSAAVIVLTIVLLVRRVGARLELPIVRLSAGAEAVIRHDYTHEVAPCGAHEFRTLIGVFNEMVRGLRERFNLMATLEKLLSPELAAQVAAHGLVLGGKRVEITNLFTDFAGFSTITRGMPPEEVVEMLNEYFAELVPLIKSWGGMPDKFIGDAVVAIFGAPVPLENHAENATCCAIAMQRRLRVINRERRAAGRPVFEMRIGLNSGEVIAGAIGTDMKLEYTAIGEAVNLANRMETMSPIGHLLVAEPTYAHIRDIFFPGAHVAANAELVTVKGYAQPVPSYHVWVDNDRIGKNPSPESPADFYVYGQVDNHVHFTLQDFPEAERAAFRKTAAPA